MSCRPSRMKKEEKKTSYWIIFTVNYFSVLLFLWLEVPCCQNSVEPSGKEIYNSNTLNLLVQIKFKPGYILCMMNNKFFVLLLKNKNKKRERERVNNSVTKFNLNTPQKTYHTNSAGKGGVTLKIEIVSSGWCWGLSHCRVTPVSWKQECSVTSVVWTGPSLTLRAAQINSVKFSFMAAVAF